MIKITFYGVDQYTVGHYSQDHSKNLASLFETNEDELMFVGSDAYIFNKGVEQTSWQALVKIDASEKFEKLEDKVATYILKTLVEYSIHVNVTFEYYHGHHEHSYINKDYPRFMKDDNLVNVEESDDDEELYEGNIFAGMEKQLEEAYKEQEGHECCCENEECHCHEEGHKCCCEDDDECCGEHECCCGHHHN